MVLTQQVPVIKIGSDCSGMGTDGIAMSRRVDSYALTCNFVQTCHGLSVACRVAEEALIVTGWD